MWSHRESYRNGSGQTAHNAELDQHCSARRLYDVFRNIRRRYVLYHAKQTGEPISVDELVTRIARWENPFDADGSARDHHRSIYNSLQQTHLPKLEDVGLVEYDREAKSIALTDQADRVDVYPAVSTSVWESRYRLLYLFVAVVLVVDILSTLLSMPFSSPAWLKVVYFTVISLTMKASYGQYRRLRRLREDGPDITIE